MSLANPQNIIKWANMTKCRMCRHTKEEGHILPKGKFWPSPAWMFHYQDTHGFPHEFASALIVADVYDFPKDLVTLSRIASE